MSRTDDLSTFWERGYAFPFKAMEPAEAEELRRLCERFEERFDTRAQRTLRTKAHLLTPWLHDLVRRPTILDAVEACIGPDILVWGCGFVIKEPGDGSFVSWHQDCYYWRWEPHRQVTAWIAVTDVTPENGAMMMIDTPADVGVIPHAEVKDSRNLLMRGQTLQADLSGRPQVAVPLRRGEFSLHHEFTFHGSGANRTQDRRIGFSVQYIAAGMKEVEGPRSSATLVRGRDHGNFDPEPVPGGEMEPDLVQFHRTQQQLYLSVVRG